MPKWPLFCIGTTTINRPKAKYGRLVRKWNLVLGLMHANQLAFNTVSQHNSNACSNPAKNGSVSGEGFGRRHWPSVAGLRTPLFNCSPFLLDVMPRGKRRTRLAQTRSVGTRESDTPVFHVALEMVVAESGNKVVRRRFLCQDHVVAPPEILRQTNRSVFDKCLEGRFRSQR